MHVKLAFKHTLHLHVYTICPPRRLWCLVWSKPGHSAGLKTAPLLYPRRRPLGLTCSSGLWRWWGPSHPQDVEKKGVVDIPSRHPFFDSKMQGNTSTKNLIRLSSSWRPPIEWKCGVCSWSVRVLHCVYTLWTGLQLDSQGASLCIYTESPACLLKREALAGQRPHQRHWLWTSYTHN